MSEKTLTFDTLVEKTLNDRDFRRELVDDPESALSSAGFEPSHEVIHALEKVDWVSLNRVAEAFGSGNRIDTSFC